MGILLCPVCGNELKKDEKRLFCSNAHSFDIAKEGYVNLLIKSATKAEIKRETAKNPPAQGMNFLKKDISLF